MPYFLILFLFLSASVVAQQPISLHPSNPHYFMFRGKPTVLVSYSEHGGAVAIPDFDYVSYLDSLQKYGYNFTPLPLYALPFTPAEGLMPWAKLEDASDYNQLKYDLDKWDEVYFGRLTDFVAQAAQRGIVVEVKLFDSFYKEEAWFASPFHPSSNMNIHNNFSCNEVYSADNGELTRYQDALAVKVVETLNGFDNVFYEVLNTNWSDCSDAATDADFRRDAVRLAWQTHMADVILTTEKSLPNKHILAQSISSRSQKVDEVDARYSVCLFHSGTSKAVSLNQHLRKVIGADEQQGLGAVWQFLLSGGGFCNYLDANFTYISPEAAPQSLAFRKQLSFVKQFVESFDFAAMQPDTSAIHTDAKCWVLSKTGQDYAAYIEGSNMGDLTLNLPAGKYFVIFVDIQRGEIIRSGPFKSNGSPTKLHYQHPMNNWALRVIRQ